MSEYLGQVNHKIRDSFLPIINHVQSLLLAKNIKLPFLFVKQLLSKELAGVDSGCLQVVNHPFIPPFDQSIVHYPPCLQALSSSGSTSKTTK